MVHVTVAQVASAVNKREAPRAPSPTRPYVQQEQSAHILYLIFVQGGENGALTSTMSWRLVLCQPTFGFGSTPSGFVPSGSIPGRGGGFHDDMRVPRAS